MKSLLFIICSVAGLWAQDLEIGSKKFTESVILGEIITQLARVENIQAEHKAELGGTRILWNALLSGEIDIYPEYSGTIMNEILADKGYKSFSQAETFLDSVGLTLVGPLGFNNSYALGVLKETADNYHLRSISDLTAYPDLRFGFTNEFMDRQDGWPQLRKVYHLLQENVSGLDHDLAYKALETAKIQLMDLYSTDAEIPYYDIYILKDDKKYFPEYYAYFLVRKDTKRRFPQFFEKLQLLKNSITEEKMIEMNAAAKISREPVKKVAVNFLNDKYNFEWHYQDEDLFGRLLKNTLDHLLLVIISLSAAILVSIPLGVYSMKNRKAGQLILSTAGILQTIPSLAILVFMIPLLGIGAYPAMMLFS